MSDNQKDNNRDNQSWSTKSVGEMPFGDGFEKSLHGLIKTAGISIFKKMITTLKKMLSCSTEPFLRRDMGERRFSAVEARYGVLFWILAGVCSYYSWGSISGITQMWGFYKLGAFLHLPIMPIISAIVSLVVLVFFMFFSRENIRRVAQFREEGRTYHTRSRGLPRWDNPQMERAVVYAGFPLLLLAPVVGFGYIVSLGVTNKLAAEEQAAFYNRYLDMLDAQIEGKFMQDALLEKCPQEITQIYKPLPKTKNPQVREDIAAAAVGKPVKIVAQGPVRPGGTTTPKSPADLTDSVLNKTSIQDSEPRTHAPVTNQASSQKQYTIIALLLLVGICVGAAVGIGIYSATRPKPVALVNSTLTAPAPVQSKPVGQPPLTPAVQLAQASTVIPAPDKESPTQMALSSEPAKKINVESTASTPAVSDPAPPNVKANAETNVSSATAVEVKASNAVVTVAPISAEEQNLNEQKQIKKCLTAITKITFQQMAAITNLDGTASVFLEQQLRATGVFATSKRKNIKEIQTNLNTLLNQQVQTLQNWNTITEKITVSPASYAQTQLQEIATQAKQMSEERGQLIEKMKALKPGNASGGLVKIR